MQVHVFQFKNYIDDTEMNEFIATKEVCFVNQTESIASGRDRNITISIWYKEKSLDKK